MNKKELAYERAFVNGQNREINKLKAGVVSIYNQFLKKPRKSTLRNFACTCFWLGYECATLNILRSRKMMDDDLGGK